MKNNLPNEILHQIFSELPTSSLLRFRLVSHRFKDLITQICHRQRNITIKLKWSCTTSRSKILDLFYDTFEDPLDLPWSGIALISFGTIEAKGLHWLRREDTEKLIRIFGPQLETFETNGAYVSSLVSILNACQNIRLLKLFQEVGKYFVKSQGESLLKPKNLKILDISLTANNREFLEFFLGEIPGLHEIRIDFHDYVDSQPQIFSHLTCVPNLYINLTNCGDNFNPFPTFAFKGLNLKEVEFRMPFWIYDGHSLVKLIIHDNHWPIRAFGLHFCNQEFSIPVLDNLKYLKLISDGAKKSESALARMQKFRNDQFPRLETVEMEGIDFETNPFQSAKFEGVKELIVWDEEGEQINWHLIFPNLERFTGNPFTRKKLSYITSNFINLMHLKLGAKSIKTGAFINLTISDHIVNSTPTRRRAFMSELPQRNLRSVTLDFQGCCDIKESLVFYKNLIVNLPPLQYLGLFHTNTSESFKQALRTKHQNLEQY